jgi:uncharacterized protein DUF1264
MRALVLITILMTAACGGGNTQPQGGRATAPGDGRTAKTTALESGANMLQAKAPVEQISIYLNGFHAAKDDPSMVMESDHYCNQVNQDFAQCALFDGNGKDARLHGVEYIISAKLYSELPPEEKMYWHPHNYEVLSGELVMPGLPETVEKQALKDKINSYGKTWHFWKTGVHGERADPLPYGPPHLAWSFNHDGEVPADLLQSRDKRLNTDSEQRRKDRADLASLAKPQGGVDALAGKFRHAKGAPAGVSDDGDPNARPVPTFGVKGVEGTPKG